MNALNAYPDVIAQIAPAIRRALPALDPLRKCIERLQAELKQALLDGRATVSMHVSIDAAEQNLMAAQQCWDVAIQHAQAEIEHAAAEEASAHVAEVDEAEAAWQAELADYVGAMPPAPAGV